MTLVRTFILTVTLTLTLTLTVNLNAIECLAAPSKARGEAAQETAAKHRGLFPTIEGAKFHYVEAGSGQTVVLLHGNDGTLQDFTMSMFDQIAAKYRTIAFDRPGHGLSENPKHGIATPEEQARINNSKLSLTDISRNQL